MKIRGDSQYVDALNDARQHTPNNASKNLNQFFSDRLNGLQPEYHVDLGSKQEMETVNQHKNDKIHWLQENDRDYDPEIDINIQENLIHIQVTLIVWVSTIL